MSYKKFISKLKIIHQRLNGSTTSYDLSPYRDLLQGIKKFKSGLAHKSDTELHGAARRLAHRARGGESLDGLLMEAYALVGEAARRVLHLQPFDEQIIGGIVMHQGAIAQMQTGEGKTLAAVFPAFLNTLAGGSVHILTFNDYLARRDSLWMGPVYALLGATTGYIREGMGISERQAAYSADVCYCTAKEAGFDYLRDSIVYDMRQRVHRDFRFAIIDEADSILIDEARVPLILAGYTDYGCGTPHETIVRLARIVKNLEIDTDFRYDEYERNVYLTDEGLQRMESALGCAQLYERSQTELLMRISYALHAHYLLQKDIDYIVKNGHIELVDEFTGRVADKRQWTQGLQTAVEAKENLGIGHKGNIVNSISLQHFIQLYPKTGGMTATAQTAEEEFAVFYGLPIVVIPPHMRCNREDHPDIVFRTKQEKYRAVVEEIAAAHRQGRPILVGTQSVAESEVLAGLLKNNNIDGEVLNAKNDEHEAAIIAQAGTAGAVTISTNMAGRGTDIKLGGADERERDRVVSLGGLYVIGTNRYESRRIDDQLRGRAGRQGDPGSSRFFISLEDDLFVRYRLRDLVSPRCFTDWQPGGRLDRMLKCEIDRVQRIIAGQHLEIKKTLYKYSFLIERQRRIIEERRTEAFNDDFLLAFFSECSAKRYTDLWMRLGKERMVRLCRHIALYHIDKSWSLYLAEVADIRDGIHLRRWGGDDPLFEYNKLVIALFETMRQRLDAAILESFNAVNPEGIVDDAPYVGLQAPASTWTYIINDDPSDPMLKVGLGFNPGFSIATGLLWPLLLVYRLLKRFKRQPYITP